DVRVVVGRLRRLGDPVDHFDRGGEAGQLGGPGDPVRTAAPPVELRQRGVDRSLIQELAHEPIPPPPPTPPTARPRQRTPGLGRLVTLSPSGSCPGAPL